jgi:hypothetical protein
LIHNKTNNNMSEVSFVLNPGAGSFGKAAHTSGQHAQQIKSTALLSAFFSRNDLAGLLAQQNCMGLRLYPAFDSAGQFSLLAIAIDFDSSDIASYCLVAEGQGGAHRLTVEQAVGMLGEVQNVMQQAAQEGRGVSTPLFAESGAEGALYAKAAFKSGDINSLLDSGAAGIRFFSTRIIFNAGDQSFSTLAAVGVDASGRESGEGLVSTLPCPPNCGGGGYINRASTIG